MAITKVTANVLADNAVSASSIADGAIATAKLADDAVTTAKITDANITTAKIAADAIDSTKIADDAIDSEHYVDGSIDTAHIADDQITSAKLGAEYTTSSAVTSATTIAIDTSTADVFTWTAGHSTTISFTNVVIGTTKTLQITGGGTSYTVAFDTSTGINGGAATFNRIAGEYDDTSSTKNLIQIKFISTSEAWYTISQIAT